MTRAPEFLPAQPDWLHPESEAVPNAIASADLTYPHPALCYELGDQNGDQIIPRDVLNNVFLQPRLTVAIWQPHHITMIDMYHKPLGRRLRLNPMGESFKGWCALQRYTNGPNGAVFLTLEENLDVSESARSLRRLLFTPLGQLPPDDQELLGPGQIERVIIELPAYHETRDLPLDTGISVLANIATQEYLNTIYGPPTV